MARQMVGQRKPGLVVAIQAGKPDDGADESDDSAGKGDDQGSQPDVDTCPNCGCEYDDDTGKIVKPGAKVVGGPKDYQGADLDAMDSAPPVPGKFGSARDGAVGTEAMAHLLGALKGGA